MSKINMISIFGDGEVDFPCQNKGCSKEFKVEFKELLEPNGSVTCPHCGIASPLTGNEKLIEKVAGADKGLVPVPKN